MDQKTKSALLNQIDTFLKHKIDIESFTESFKSPLTDTYIKDLEDTISFYNANKSEILSENYLVNTIELHSIFPNDLPQFKETVQTLLSDNKLTSTVFKTLRDSSYFNEVWVLPPKHLLANLLILIYRTTVLHLHKDSLAHSSFQEFV